MSQWGRGQGLAALPAARLARRSVILAIAGYAVELAAGAGLMLMPQGLPMPWPTLLTFGLSGLFGFVGPLLHVIGALCAVRAFARPNEPKGLAVLGLILNLMAMGMVILGLYAAIGLSSAPA